PVHAACPAVAVVRVPRDRAGHAFLPRHLRLPSRLALELLVADAERDHLARAGPVAAGETDQLAAGGPVAALLAYAEDQFGPVPHGDVFALPVDVHVARDAARRHGQVAPHAVRAEAEVPQRLELAELDARAHERLRDDRAG